MCTVGGLDCHAEGSHLATDFHVPCNHYLTQSLQQVTSHLYIFKGLTFHCCGYCIPVIPWTASGWLLSKAHPPTKIKILDKLNITCHGSLLNEHPSMSLRHSSRETAEIVPASVCVCVHGLWTLSGCSPFYCSMQLIIRLFHVSSWTSENVLCLLDRFQLSG